MFLLKVTQILDKYKVQYAIVGGYAVVLHGYSRGTMDIDLIIQSDLKSFQAIEKAFAEIDLKPRLPLKAEELFQFKAEYIRERNLIAWTFVNYDQPSEIVDVVLTEDLKEHKTKKIKFLNENISVLALDDLIAMKQASGREQDLIDVQALKEVKK